MTNNRITRSDVVNSMLKSSSDAYIKHKYCQSFEDNVLPSVKIDDFFCDLIKGDGSELKGDIGYSPKFNAIESSSALCVNSFAPWKKYLKLLSISSYTNFTSLQFEYKADTTLRGKHPNYDVFIESENTIIAIESKFCEILDKTTGIISPNYKKIMDTSDIWTEPFIDNQEKLKGYDYLDAAQLIKHYYGLRKQNTSREKILLYLYWVPNNDNYDKLSPYKEHGEQLAKFKKEINKQRDVQFISMTYKELWDMWEKNHSMNHDINKHISELRMRYQFDLN